MKLLVAGIVVLGAMAGCRHPHGKSAHDRAAPAMDGGAADPWEDPRTTRPGRGAADPWEDPRTTRPGVAPAPSVTAQPGDVQL